MKSLPPWAWFAPIALVFLSIVGFSVFTLMRWREDLRDDPSTYECPSTPQDIAGGSQWPTVVGKLVDERTGKPIISAFVGIGPNGGELVTRQRETDESGHFKLGGVCRGVVRLFASCKQGGACQFESGATFLLPNGFIVRLKSNETRDLGTLRVSPLGSSWTGGLYGRLLRRILKS